MLISSEIRAVLAHRRQRGGTDQKRNATHDGHKKIDFAANFQRTLLASQCPENTFPADALEDRVNSLMLYFEY
jgi:hypothetical protein